MQDFTMDYIEIVGFVAAILTTSAFVPQVYKTWKTKDVGGVSLTMYLAMFTGIVLWLTYGLYIHSLSIITANIVSGILVFSIIIMKLRHKKQ